MALVKLRAANEGGEETGVLFANAEIFSGRELLLCRSEAERQIVQQAAAC